MEADRFLVGLLISYCTCNRFASSIRRTSVWDALPKVERKVIIRFYLDGSHV